MVDGLGRRDKAEAPNTLVLCRAFLEVLPCSDTGAQGLQSMLESWGPPDRQGLGDSMAGLLLREGDPELPAGADTHFRSVVHFAGLGLGLMGRCSRHLLSLALSLPLCSKGLPFPWHLTNWTVQCPAILEATRATPVMQDGLWTTLSTVQGKSGGAGIELGTAQGHASVPSLGLSCWPWGFAEILSLFLDSSSIKSPPHRSSVQRLGSSSSFSLWSGNFLQKRPTEEWERGVGGPVHCRSGSPHKELGFLWGEAWEEAGGERELPLHGGFPSPVLQRGSPNSSGSPETQEKQPGCIVVVPHGQSSGTQGLTSMVTVITRDPWEDMEDPQGLIGYRA